jgi:predicted component of type VI protein secretion system
VRKKIDAPFLSKLSGGPVYIRSTDDLLKSVADEIGNILSSRLMIPDGYVDGDIYNFPFAYGVRDLQSVGISRENLDAFKSHCRKAILRFECRISDVEIGDVAFDKSTQQLKMDISFTLKDRLTKFTTEVTIT